MYYYNLSESGKCLRELRIKKGNVHTQVKVAEKVGISREYLNRLEAGKRDAVWIYLLYLHSIMV